MLINISMFVHLPSEITLEVWWLHLGTQWPPTSPIASSHPSSLHFCLYIFPLLGPWWLLHCLYTCHGKAFASSCAHAALWAWKTYPFLSTCPWRLASSTSPIAPDWLSLPASLTADIHHPVFQLMLLSLLHMCWSYQLDTQVRPTSHGLCLPSLSPSTHRASLSFTQPIKIDAVPEVSHQSSFNHVLSLPFLCFSFPSSFLFLSPDANPILPPPWSHKDFSHSFLYSLLHQHRSHLHVVVNVLLFLP